MNPTPEQLAAFADGELGPHDAARIAEFVEKDPELALQVCRHRELKARLGSHFAPILQQPVPERLAAPLHKAPATVVNLAEAAARKRQRATLPRRWAWLAGPALAASLALAVFLPRGSERVTNVDPALVAVLDRQVSGTGTPADAAQVLLSFRNDAGSFCRAFEQDQRHAIACRTDEGWRLVTTAAASPSGGGDYRQAGSGEVLAKAQDMARGPALSAEEERQAIVRGWSDGLFRRR